MSTLGAPRNKSFLIFFDHGVQWVMLWGRHMDGSSENGKGWSGWNALRLPTNQTTAGQLLGQEPFKMASRNTTDTCWLLKCILFAPNQLHSLIGCGWMFFLHAMHSATRLMAWPTTCFLLVYVVYFFCEAGVNAMKYSTPLISMGLFGTITCSELKDQNARIFPICFHRSFLSLHNIFKTFDRQCMLLKLSGLNFKNI